MSSTKYIIRARGLPWSATADEVLEFFNECTVVGGSSGVHFSKDGENRPSGVCFIEVESEDDVSAALKKDREKMGRRYIEVFTSTREDMDDEMSRSNRSASSGDFEEDAVVRLRGLPFSADQSDVKKFFEGLNIEDNGILMVSEASGRPKGEAFVQFKDTSGARSALERTKQMMGHRYIEVFPSTMEEARRTQAQMTFGPMRGGGGPMRGGGYGMRPGPYDRMGGGGRNSGYGMRGGGGGYGYGGPMMGPGAGMMPPNMMVGGGCATVRMRGLPFRVSEQEIAEWFSSVADPVDIFIRYGSDNRPTGEADVSFATEGDAKRAMQKNRHNMQHRYIELFMDKGY